MSAVTHDAPSRPGQTPPTRLSPRPESAPRRHGVSRGAAGRPPPGSLSPAEVRESSQAVALLARVLGGAWCDPPPYLPLDEEELERVTPLLLASRTTALGWWRIRQSPLRDTPAASQLQKAYLFGTLDAAVCERQVEQAIRLLRAAGVDHLLVEDWPVARLYSERGLRPCTDVDLCVRPEQYAAAFSALSGPDSPGLPVHLRQGVAELDDRGLDELYLRSRLAMLGGARVRLLGAEDQLRYLCLRLLARPTQMPLALCDVAAALETSDPEFDWGYCLSGDRWRSAWVVCALGLAHRILGARLDWAPKALRRHRLPGWLVPAVLRRWETGLRRAVVGPDVKPFRPRWPDAVEATARLRAPLNGLPRQPFQLCLYLARLARAAL